MDSPILALRMKTRGRDGAPQTQAEFAEALGINRANLSLLENGRTSFTSGILAAFAAAGYDTEKLAREYDEWREPILADLRAGAAAP